MKSNYSRRDFLATSTAVAAGLGFGLGSVPGRARDAEAGSKRNCTRPSSSTSPRKTSSRGSRTPALTASRRASCRPRKPRACRKVAEKCGMRIHSVLRGWAEFNSDDPSKVDKTLRRHRGRLARGAGLRRGCRAAGAVPHRRNEDARAPGVRHRVRSRDQPPHARRCRRQRPLRGLHQGPQSRH